VSDPEVELLKKQLEDLKIEHERLKSERQSWLDRHLGVIVTALVSLATLSFSAVQWRVAQVNEANAQAQQRQAQAEDESRRDEEWKFRALEFVFSHERYFFGDDPGDFQRAVRILAVGFPERISEPLLKRLELTASPAEKLELKTIQAQMRGEQPPPRPPQPKPPTPPEPARKPLRTGQPLRENPTWQERPRPWREDPPQGIPDRPRVREERPLLRHRR